MEIKNKLVKIVQAIEVELGLIEDRLGDGIGNLFELELDQNSIHIETFSVKTYRDQSSVYL
ncbi:uncharacterized protein MELLADRAFT_75239 [Melampsora larici-populina 98AG31]|uniref:Uncharacterized protein n=1 Tax=Melampsora larici-populina (strain 98AG31 / pathotype 3-4-7) TaxID=747676 RepID=F4RUA4_MELLP|nr:uncharacterized protein MELLADRAFT_75239 [Melampsora larici-populina 98AG31]EGG04033.1 hypothetical protein MELLADRAFT_75239 [Melampsora larici-populina 98AG31]